jgi:hypothetical protein
MSTDTDTTCIWCGALAQVGPDGGYVCGQCYYVALPPGYTAAAETGRERIRSERAVRKARERRG